MKTLLKLPYLYATFYVALQKRWEEEDGKFYLQEVSQNCFYYRFGMDGPTFVWSPQNSDLFHELVMFVPLTRELSRLHLNALTFIIG